MAVGGRTLSVAGLLLAVTMLAVGALPSAAPAAPGDQDRRDRLDPDPADQRASAGPRQVPAGTVPVLGDFDGDGAADLLWYGPGARDDHLWLGRPSRNFAGVPLVVRGHYLPLAGDFDGDHRADVLWYGPGGQPDVLWLGRPGGRFSARARTVRGSYQPLLGDFDGDGRRDIFWYGPGGQPDVLWLGRPGGRFSARARPVQGSYQPLVGDFDGDGARDIVWYRPGAGADVAWFGGAGARFRGRPLRAPDGAAPFTGDFDGDGARDIVWYRPGAAADRLWYGGARRFRVAAVAVQGSYQPQVADFGGDGPDDVLWWAPGPANDVLWFGRARRRFTSRSTTLDLDYARAPAIRPEALAEGYDPFGFVAHAFGSVRGLAYTNSLEAFQRNYGRGFRVFECDHVLLADGTALLAHNGLEANYGLRRHFRDSTWDDLAGHRYKGQLTILRSRDVLRLLAEHPDAYMIPDPKWGRVQIWRTYVRQATAMGRPDLLERVMPHVADQAELDALRAFYPLRNYVLALYHTQMQNRMDDAAAVRFVRRNRTPAAMMWWRPRRASLSLADNGRQGRRYRPSLARGLRAAGAVVYVHSLTDPAAIGRFWDLGIGVYSDEPFPPLDAGGAQVRTPNFAPDSIPPA